MCTSRHSRDVVAAIVGSPLAIVFGCIAVLGYICVQK